MNSKAKGAAGERELAKKLREYGYDAKRDGQQGNGSAGDHPDVVGLERIHIECKRVEKLNISDALSQSIRDSLEGEVPVVIHRRNHEEWKVTMKLDDWIKLYEAWR